MKSIKLAVLAMGLMAGAVQAASSTELLDSRVHTARKYTACADAYRTAGNSDLSMKAQMVGSEYLREAKESARDSASDMRLYEFLKDQYKRNYEAEIGLMGAQEFVDSECAKMPIEAMYSSWFAVK